MGKSRRKARRLRARERFVRKTKVAALQLAQGCVREVFSGWKKKPGYVFRAAEAGWAFSRKSTREGEIRWELNNVAWTAASCLYELECERKLEKERDKKGEPKSWARRSRLENVCWNLSLYAFFGLMGIAAAVAYTPDRWRAIPIALCAFFMPVLYCAFFPSRDETP